TPETGLEIVVSDQRGYGSFSRWTWMLSFVCLPLDAHRLWQEYATSYLIQEQIFVKFHTGIT
ncbi:MAG: hypothetical protein KF751_18805, partial [Nitrospira sp.]|nr:hypothetical protein [Nitrospira sp.]